jgi:hypothetical protein
MVYCTWKNYVFGLCPLSNVSERNTAFRKLDLFPSSGKMMGALTNRPNTVGKAVPLHAMQALGERGNIALGHSRPRHQMGVSGQRHAPAALYPRGKDSRYPLDRMLGGPQSRSGHTG